MKRDFTVSAPDANLMRERADSPNQDKALLYLQPISSVTPQTSPVAKVNAHQLLVFQVTGP